MKMKSGLIALSGLLISAITLTILHMRVKTSVPPFTCNAIVFQSRYFNSNDYASKLSLSIKLNDNRMLFSVNGRFQQFDKTYIFIRTAEYAVRSSKSMPGTLHLTTVSTLISREDTVPPVYANRYFPFATSGKEGVMKLTRMPSGDLLFTSPLGPFFICNTANKQI